MLGASAAFGTACGVSCGIPAVRLRLRPHKSHFQELVFLLKLHTDVQECLSLFDVLAHLVDALEVHHVQAAKAFLRSFRIEESEVVKLLCPLVLLHAGEGVLFLRLDLDVKDRLAVKHLAVRASAHRLVLQLGIVEVNKIVTAAVVRADNAEAARHIVELPDQLNAHGIDLRVRTVAGGDHIPAGLVSGLLKCGNGGSRRHAGANAAAVHVAVRGGVLHFLYLHLHDIDVNIIQGGAHDLFQAPIVQFTLHMDNRLVPVHELVLVDVGGIGCEVPALRRHHGIFKDVAGQLVDVKLRVLADRHIAEADGRSLLREQHIQNDRV